MNTKEPIVLEEALMRLGWSQAELARRLDVHENTVVQWKAGVVPGYAAAYLRLAMGVRSLGEEVEPVARTRRVR